MKTKLLVALVSCLCFACKQEKNPPEVSTSHQTVRIGGSELLVFTVTIDGKEYYATRNAYSFNLCPKVP